MTIQESAIKGYIGKIVIEIYHNNKEIDFDSIEEAYKDDCAELQNQEREFIEGIN
jgi:hypothetical protein